MFGVVLLPTGFYHWRRYGLIARRLGYDTPRMIDPRVTGGLFIGLGTLCVAAAVVGLVAQVLGS